MSYLPPPWTLKGYGLQILQIMEIDSVRALIPSEFKIISVGFGKTIGGVYLASYESGSTLEYHELIVSPALVRYGNQSGGWISHIYVDHPDSVAGGREIWGLPKELATFEWENGNTIKVYQGSKLLYSLNYQPKKWSLPLSLTLPSFGILDSDILRFQANFKSNLSLINSQFKIPTESPFANLGLEKPGLTLSLNCLTLSVSEPKIIK